MAEEFRARRSLVVERVRALHGFRLPQIPQGAFYAFPNISELIGKAIGGRMIEHGDSFAAIALDEAKVAIVGGNDFGAPEYVRISYAASRDNLNAAFDRIAEFLKKLN
jgi:aspartate aminotransferase